MMNGITADFFNEKGFSLVEVLITAAIMAVGLLAMAQMQIVAIRSNADTRSHTEATNLAIGQVEYLKKLPFICPAGMAEKDYWLTDVSHYTNTDGSGTRCTIDSCAEYVDGACGNLLQGNNPAGHEDPDYPVDWSGYPLDPNKQKYGMFWNIEDYQDKPLKAVTVTVSWYNGPQRGKKHITFSTIISDPR